MRVEELKTILKSSTKQTQASRYLGPIKYYGQEIAQFHNPQLIIDDIFNENETKNFTSILLVGTPGTGKTTLAQFIAHSLHQKKPFKVVWYGKKDIIQLDEILDNLPSQDHILIFDDVSLALRRIKDPGKRMDILEALTTVRHPKNGPDRNVITIANIHYTMALEKMWRGQGSYKIFTDLQGEDLQNFNNFTGYKFQRRAETFSKIALTQFRKKKFTVSLTNTRDITYETNKPFRIQAVYDGVDLRFMLTPKLGCGLCSPDFKQNKQFVDAKTLVEKAHEYHGQYGTQALRVFLLFKGHKEASKNKFNYAYEDMLKLFEKYDVDYNQLGRYLREKSNVRLTRPYRKKDPETKEILDQKLFIEGVLKESGLEQKPPKNPDENISNFMKNLT